MIKTKKIILNFGSACIGTVSLISIVSCGSPSQDLNKLEDFIVFKDASLSIPGGSKWKEIVAFKQVRPTDINLSSKIGLIWYQTRAGLIGTIKVQLMSGKDSKGSSIYFGREWKPNMGSFVGETIYNFNNMSQYDNWLSQFHTWAFTSIQAKVAKAFKLTPVEITYDFNWNNVSTAEYKN